MARICDDYKEWFEEKIETPIEEQEKRTRKECKKKKCKKWCLCCNKWFCWLAIFFIWIVKWIIKIVGKWLVYTVCRIIGVFLTLGLTILNIIGWPVKWLGCIFWGDSDVEKLPMHDLKLEVIIVDYDDETRNPCTNDEIDDRIKHADRILRARARIAVQRSSAIRRMNSKALYRIDASGIGGKISEYLKGFVLLLGRNSWRNLTVYVVGNISNAEGLHLPLYGSVFIGHGTYDTTLCHEIGHALLSVFNTYHSNTADHLMYTPPDERELACGWPKGLPKLSRNERCTMRRSRWLDWSWIPIIP
ncbi:hypothetical protein LLG96_19965 [bacterium]|nr:hypothetical protein [bacterium]